jgi:Tfp pilus assembly protein PilZ
MAHARSTSVAACDKRDQLRKPKRVMVRYGTRMPNKTAFTKNISATGLFIQTNSVFNPGSTIQVHLQFEDRRFVMWARVRWAKRVPAQLAGVMAAGMGVQFVDPTPDWVAYYRESIDG